MTISLRALLIAVLLSIPIWGGAVWWAADAYAREGQIPKPILRPVGLYEAKQLCGNNTPKVECRAEIRRRIAALAWQRERAMHARSLPASNLTPLEVGRALAQRAGWTGSQWVCLATLWSRESGWVPTKLNYAGSGAYGIPQALPGSKMRSAGADWRTNPATQIRWGLGYIKARYGTPCGALAQSDAHGYY